IIALIACSGFIVWWFRVYLTSEPVASVDLPSLIALAGQLKTQLLHGHVSFYDATTFTGMPAFQFYGFFPSLLVVLLSFPCALLSADSITLSTHLLLIAGAAALPFSLYFSALPLANEIANAQGFLSRTQRWVLAIMCATWSFWFLNHDQHWYGIGAASPMNIGLFSQLFGWHFFLIHSGFLLRFIQHGGNRLIAFMAVAYALILVSHTMTFVFSTFIVLLSWVWFHDKRSGLLKAHILGIGLTAFWFFPFIAFMGEYTSYSIIRPKGDFLELFFRYPVYGLLRSFKTWFSGEFKLLNPINIINVGLVLTLFCHRQISKSGLTWTLFVFLILALVVFSSGFIATSFPVGLHYYRFLAYCFLLLVLIVCVIPLVFIKEQSSLLSTLFTLIVVACFVITAALPHHKRELIEKNSSSRHVAVQHRIFDYFKSIHEKGRVYVEHIKEHNQFAPLSRHYLSAFLHDQSGFEGIVGSHLQESVSYRMIVASANMLGAKTYHSAFLFIQHATLSDQDNIDRLKAFGITHLIAGRNQFFQKIKRFAVTEPVTIGPYRIVEIQKPPTQLIAAVDKPVIGFVDLQGNIPFHLLEFYFYARTQLSNQYELVRIEDPSSIPLQINTLLVNVARNQGTEKLRSQQIEIHYSPRYLLDHYKPHYPHNVEVDAYHELENYLDNTVNLPEQVALIRGKARYSVKTNNMIPVFNWSEDKQTISLQQLMPGQLYRINYSHFPYWHSSDGTVLRGAGERIFFVADKDKATIDYSRWHFKSTYLGYLATILSIIYLVFLFTRQRDK
ncbi:MAG: hypothetical protein K0U68_12570, partial [Gammaproteobacteria bacterium]|nr:hypothetical protein [Gammaproteobacteria bacterium]